MRRRLNKKGQSTLEYLLVLAGIVAALIVFKASINTKITSVLNDAGDQIQGATEAALRDLSLDTGTGDGDGG